MDIYKHCIITIIDKSLNDVLKIRSIGNALKAAILEDNQYVCWNTCRGEEITLYFDVKDGYTLYEENIEISDSCKNVIGFTLFPNNDSVLHEFIKNDGYHMEGFKFFPPKVGNCNVTIYAIKIKEKEKLEMNNENEKIENISNAVIDTFEIPEELAKELSELLTKQLIREKMLQQVIGDPVKYENMENMLIPITSNIEAIKVKITNEYVPSQYNSIEYIWNYNGYEVDGNKVQILRG